jgi:hypothetical protein
MIVEQAAENNLIFLKKAERTCGRIILQSRYFAKNPQLAVRSGLEYVERAGACGNLAVRVSIFSCVYPSAATMDLFVQRPSECVLARQWRLGSPAKWEAVAPKSLGAIG